ncbi:unnamed protein product, partial [Arabidopsis halleri]
MSLKITKEFKMKEKNVGFKQLLISIQDYLKWLARLGLRSILPEDNSLAPKTDISGFGWPAIEAPYRTKTPHGWTTSSFTTSLAEGSRLDVPPLRDIFNMGQHADSAYARGNRLVSSTIQSSPGIQLGHQAYSMVRSNPDASSNAYTNHNAQYGDLSGDFSYLWNPLVGVRTAPISKFPWTESSDEDSDSEIFLGLHGSKKINY